jgi:RHS repeat-associated protein
MQAATAGVDELTEVYPTCFRRSFANAQEILTRIDPDPRPNLDVQQDIHKETTLNAVGRVVQRRAFLPAQFRGNLEADFERATFGYDLLGHMTSMTRYQDATNKLSPVTTNWHYDSLAWMTRLEEPGVAPQTRTFDTWGEVTTVQWCFDSSEAPCPTQDRRTVTSFDGRGRVFHSADLTDSSGQLQPVPQTVRDFHYDTNSAAIGGIPRNNVRGRLATATWPTGLERFTYDDFGRVNSRTYVDTTVTPNPHNYEIHEFYADGSEKALHLQLQDTNKADERVNYAYDSAGRVNSVVVYDYQGSQSLFAASGPDPIYDPFGRIVKAKYGLAQVDATFAATGRRLLTDVKVTSVDQNGQQHSREISFPVLNGVTPFDAMGRERGRRELTDGTGPVALLRNYDRIGRLSTSQNLQIATNTTQDDRAFSYDALGNILTQADASTGNPGSVSLSYGPPDLDRICGVAYGGALAPEAPACNVTHDGAGNVTSMPTNANSVIGTSGTRTFEYFPSGAVKTIADGGTNATFDYDAFGGLQQLTLNTTLADPRTDKYFGAYIKQRVENGNTVTNRQIPAPGLTATRHGPTTNWTFAFGEPRGTRFVTDKNGAFVQTIDYNPYGEVKNPTGATPGTTNYTSEQWNGGDLLKALGVVNLGARIYEPVIGRFLAPDPIISATSRYAFASNDPVNRFDPTGLEDGPADDGDRKIVKSEGDLNPSPAAELDHSDRSGSSELFGSFEGISDPSNRSRLDHGVTGSFGAGAAGGAGSGNEGDIARAAGLIKASANAALYGDVHGKPSDDRPADDRWAHEMEPGAPNDGLGPLKLIPGFTAADAIYDCATGRECHPSHIIIGLIPGPKILRRLPRTTRIVATPGKTGGFTAKVGLKTAGTIATKVEGDALRISWIAVQREMRRQGIATALIDRAIQSAEASGPAINTITATTNHGAVGALTKALESLGFHVTPVADDAGVELSAVR